MIKSRGISKRGFLVILATVLVLTFLTEWKACALEGFSSGKLSIVTEPGKYSQYLHYYKDNNTEKSLNDIVWEDKGVTGKAISLSGEGEYIEIGYNQLQMHTMTFAGWFFWKGTAQGQEDASMYRQRLFTMSHSDDVWLSVMPHAKNTSHKNSTGKIIDGVYMGFAMGANKIDLWNPAKAGKESYGLPINEWHHIAMTMNGQMLKLYVDGRLWFENKLVLGVEQMHNNKLTIGSGLWGDPTLNALIDEMALYDFALTAKQVAMLYAGVDPLAKGASIPPTTIPSFPEEPTISDAMLDTNVQSSSSAQFLGLPIWSVILIAVILSAVIILSVVLSIYQPVVSQSKIKTSNDKTNMKNSEGSSDKGGSER